MRFSSRFILHPVIAAALECDHAALPSPAVPDSTPDYEAVGRVAPPCDSARGAWPVPIPSGTGSLHLQRELETSFLNSWERY